jgi:hypothetical protein
MTFNSLYNTFLVQELNGYFDTTDPMSFPIINVNKNKLNKIICLYFNYIKKFF